MADTASVSTASGTAIASRSVRLIRPTLLFLGGLAVAFTAALHHELRFDQWLIAGVLVLLGAAYLIEWFAGTRTSATVRAQATVLIQGIVAVIAAIALPFAADPLPFAIVLAAWALVCGLLEFIGAVAGTGRDSAWLGALGVLLAILLLLVREDLVAVVGFFGGYAVVSGVFLGIAAFDARGAARPDHSTAN